jgi:DNA-binding response OmpR family regulator
MRILVVEDEKKLSELIARALRAERYAVDVALDGHAAWQMIETYEYDLVILDLMLPGLDGAEILRRTRRRNQHVPILILTALDATSEKVRNFEAGADDYLTKPFAFAELLVRVKALMRRGPVSRSSRCGARAARSSSPPRNMRCSSIWRPIRGASSRAP